MPLNKKFPTKLINEMYGIYDNLSFVLSWNDFNF